MKFFNKVIFTRTWTHVLQIEELTLLHKDDASEKCQQLNPKLILLC